MWWSENRQVDNVILRDAIPYCIYEERGEGDGIDGKMEDELERGEEQLDREKERANQLLISGKWRSSVHELSGDFLQSATFPPHVFLPIQVDADGNMITERPLLSAAETDDIPWGLRMILQAVTSDLQLDTKTAYKLKMVLLEAKPHRSKWYDPNRPGQGELYEALERVLSDLKAFTPHSIPFLHRVSKKDVPDYHMIIKNPMDLSTMHKKLRSHEYRSKAEFCADLNLIYDNCMTYNTAADSPLRVAGRLLKEKWVLLLNKVPDIAISSPSQHTPDTTDEIDLILDEELKIISDEDLDSVDQLIDPDLAEGISESCQAQISYWPRRSGELMRSFRRSQQIQQDVDAADLALFFNAFPDTWSLDGKCARSFPKNHKAEDSGVDALLDCVNLHHRLGSHSRHVVQPVDFNRRIDSTFCSRKATLKLAAMILAAHGCDENQPGLAYYTNYKQRLQKLTTYQEELKLRTQKHPSSSPEHFVPNPASSHRAELQHQDTVHSHMHNKQDTLSDVQLTDEEEYILNEEEVAALRSQQAVMVEAADSQQPPTPPKRKRTKSNKE